MTENSRKLILPWKEKESDLFYEDSMVVEGGELSTVRRVHVIENQEVVNGNSVGWILNDDICDCMICNQSFGYFRYRYHCRACGILVCSKCSPEKALIDYLTDSGPQRVCGQCFYGQDVVTAVMTTYCLHSEVDNKDNQSASYPGSGSSLPIDLVYPVPRFVLIAHRSLKNQSSSELKWEEVYINLCCHSSVPLLYENNISQRPNNSVMPRISFTKPHLFIGDDVYYHHDSISTTSYDPKSSQGVGEQESWRRDDIVGVARDVYMVIVHPAVIPYSLLFSSSDEAIQIKHKMFDHILMCLQAKFGMIFTRNSDQFIENIGTPALPTFTFPNKQSSANEHAAGSERGSSVTATAVDASHSNNLQSAPYSLDYRKDVPSAPTSSNNSNITSNNSHTLAVLGVTTSTSTLSSTPSSIPLSIPLRHKKDSVVVDTAERPQTGVALMANAINSALASSNGMTSPSRPSFLPPPNSPQRTLSSSALSSPRELPNSASIENFAAILPLPELKENNSSKAINAEGNITSLEEEERPFEDLISIQKSYSNLSLRMNGGYIGVGTLPEFISNERQKRIQQEEEIQKARSEELLRQKRQALRPVQYGEVTTEREECDDIDSASSGNLNTVSQIRAKFEDKKDSMTPRGSLDSNVNGIKITRENSFVIDRESSAPPETSLPIMEATGDKDLHNDTISSDDNSLGAYCGLDKNAYNNDNDLSVTSSESSIDNNSPDKDYSTPQRKIQRHSLVAPSAIGSEGFGLVRMESEENASESLEEAGLETIKRQFEWILDPLESVHAYAEVYKNVRYSLTSSLGGQQFGRSSKLFGRTFSTIGSPGDGSGVSKTQSPAGVIKAQSPGGAISPTGVDNGNLRHLLLAVGPADSALPGVRLLQIDPLKKQKVFEVKQFTWKIGTSPPVDQISDTVFAVTDTTNKKTYKFMDPLNGSGYWIDKIATT